VKREIERRVRTVRRFGFETNPIEYRNRNRSTFVRLFFVLRWSKKKKRSNYCSDERIFAMLDSKDKKHACISRPTDQSRVGFGGRKTVYASGPMISVTSSDDEKYEIDLARDG